MSGPSVFWYTTRSAGMVLLVLLTASVVLGVLTNGRWTTAGVPRFVTSSLHRNLSLLTLVFLVLHIVTAIVDSFAHLGLKDALIPFASDYRRLWMGLGVVAAELFIALVITSLVRGLFGYGAWRLIHLLAYVSWPLALLHGVGTGSDTRAWWALLINFACVTAVFVALAWRAYAVSAARSASHGVLAIATAGGAVALIAFLLMGPLRPGWAIAAGTPANLLIQSTSNGASTASAYTLPRGLNDQLQGSLTQTPSGGALVTLSDVRDPALQVVITISDPNATAVSVAVTHNAQAVCSTQAAVSQGLTAICGMTQLAVQRLVQNADGSVQGVLVTQAA
ncbi:MAG TPA: ferric reductase-like transmembrane domain-containing protein [Candidatus Limnocylindrales bacterium]|nr:ferric reductase-like transmembrane domain-containing protein [Candidatus Limnocylindrales bacterium]